jgi:hypothetical protein
MVVDTAVSERRSFFKSLIIYIIKKTFNPWDRGIHFIAIDPWLNKVPIGVSVKRARNINGPDLIRSLRELKADLALLMGCPQIVSSELLNSFPGMINYHNSLLPKYRGLEATSWAMTNEEELTGFTFHLVNERIDDGKLILQEAMKLDYQSSSYENELTKTNMAAECLGKLLNRFSESPEGHDQLGESSYFGKEEKLRLLEFDELDDIPKIRKLIGIWGGVYLRRGTGKVYITSLTEDGEIRRISWLPPWLYWFCQI